jgi:uncharacterized protein (TIGR02466 family)
MKELLIPLASIPLFIVEDFKKLSETEYTTLVNLEEKLSSGGGENYISLNRQLLELSGFKDLKVSLQTALNRYVHDILKIENQFFITDSWATRNPQNTFHAEHSHGNSIFSGVLYVDVADGDLELLFDPLFSKNFQFEYSIKEYNLLNSNSWSLGLKSGMLVIFPSWVSHRVSPNLNTSDRRIIGFNSFTSGKFGSDLTIDNLNINLL